MSSTHNYHIINNIKTHRSFMPSRSFAPGHKSLLHPALARPFRSSSCPPPNSPSPFITPSSPLHHPFITPSSPLHHPFNPPHNPPAPPQHPLRPINPRPRILFNRMHFPSRFVQRLLRSRHALLASYLFVPEVFSPSLALPLVEFESSASGLGVGVLEYGDVVVCECVIVSVGLVSEEFVWVVLLIIMVSVSRLERGRGRGLSIVGRVMGADRG